MSVQLAFWLLVVFCLAIYAILARSAPEEVDARRKAEEDSIKRRRAEARARIVERRPPSPGARSRRLASGDTEAAADAVDANPGSSEGRTRAARQPRPPFPFALPFKLPFKLKWPFKRRRRRRASAKPRRPAARRR